MFGFDEQTDRLAEAVAIGIVEASTRVSSAEKTGSAMIASVFGARGRAATPSRSTASAEREARLTIS